MAGILVIGEVLGDNVTKESLETISVAKGLSSALNQPLLGALICGGELSIAAEQFDCGFSSLHLIGNEGLTNYLAQPIVAAAEALIAKLQPSVVLFPHTAKTRDWVPQLAAKLGTGLAMDCVDVAVCEGGLTVRKPMHGGGVMGQLDVLGNPALATVRGAVAECAVPSRGAKIERMEAPYLNQSPRIRHLESIPTKSGEGPKLKDAKTIISGGRGTGARENWHLIEEAARVTGAAVGCSRAIVDMGWLNWNHQVGLSGTTVAPDLYLAVGISGAVQHLAGISNAKIVVAINNDPEAEIFSRADYGVVGDCLEVLPAFIERVAELRKLAGPDQANGRQGLNCNT